MILSYDRIKEILNRYGVEAKVGGNQYWGYKMYVGHLDNQSKQFDLDSFKTIVKKQINSNDLIWDFGILSIGMSDKDNISFDAFVLFNAASFGMLDGVKHIYEKNQDPKLINTIDPESGTTSLLTVAEKINEGKKFRDIVEFLLSKGADLSIKNRQGQDFNSLLENSVWQCNNLKLEINHKKLNSHLNACQINLFQAVEENKPELVKKLLKQGTNPDFDIAISTDSNDIATPLIYAISKSSNDSNLDIVKALLDKADPNYRTSIDSFLPLHTAISQNNPKIAHLLVEKGIDIEEVEGGSYLGLELIDNDSQDKCFGNGNALFLACVLNKPEIVKMLLEMGADMEYGATLYSESEDTGTGVDLLMAVTQVKDLSPEIEKLLLSYGAGITKDNDERDGLRLENNSKLSLRILEFEQSPDYQKILESNKQIVEKLAIEGKDSELKEHFKKNILPNFTKLLEASSVDKSLQPIYFKRMIRNFIADLTATREELISSELTASGIAGDIIQYNIMPYGRSSGLHTNVYIISQVNDIYEYCISSGKTAKVEDDEKCPQQRIWPSTKVKGKISTCSTQSVADLIPAS
jgi:ankyrin repeat protein